MSDQKSIVTVDPEVCEGFGVCARIDKSVFALAEDKDLVVIKAQPETPEILEKVKLAVKRCPKQALKLLPR